MPRALLLALAVLALAAATAAAQSDPDPAPALTFAHDSSLDGTPREIHSGLYPGDAPGTTDPLAARHPNTYETFAITVPEHTRHSSLTAHIAWADPRVDLDLSVYRAGADGRPTGTPVARSAGKPRAFETAVSGSTADPVEPGDYVVVVDNVCSRDADDDPRSSRPADRANCGIGGPVPDEDDFSGDVKLGNQVPSVTLIGPDSVPAKEAATFTAEATDPEDGVLVYQFDLDGDGTYELDSDGNDEVSTSFPARGTRTIGVQVIDDAGAVAYATKEITVTRAVSKPDTRPPLTTFRLNRKHFGGAGNHRLIVSYKLREKARVTMVLLRDGKPLRLIDAGVRKRRHTYRVVLKPSHLRKAVYGVRLTVLAASGKQQEAQLSARRR